MQWDRLGAAAIGLCLIALAPIAAEAAGRSIKASLGQEPKGSQPAMRTGNWASPPVGHRDFCRNFPAECQAQGSRQAMPLTQKLWDQMSAVNDAVNRQIQPVTDREYYGTEEVWTLPDRYGDCEDYVLLKRKRLIDLGWSTSDTLVAVVFDEVGDGHAVLVVRTDRGDFILDNKVDAVRLWSETGYRYVKRQDITDPMRWVAIDDTRWQMNGSTAGLR